jgi:peptide/nickel transport system ATP-binding protein
MGRKSFATIGPMNAPLLEVRGLTTAFHTDAGSFNAVDAVDLSIEAGRTLGLVGESGCGKSVTALSVMGLVSSPGKVVAGEVFFEGTDLLRLAPSALRDIRGNRISMIFQEPMTSLNPAFTIGDQIVEGILRHRGNRPNKSGTPAIGKEEAKRQAIEMLRHVRMPLPEQRFDDHPHKLSGGMRQRAMIAMALALKPRLLIADEPTTALDVTIQAQILELMRVLRDETGAAIILITHDLGVVAELAQDVAVMYAGRIVEKASVDEVFNEPQHPYTIGLLGSIPRLHREVERLPAIEGQVPNPVSPPPACRFAPRCPFATDKCRAEEPPLREVIPGHFARCWYAPIA